MKPTLGRIVLFNAGTASNLEQYAAIIINVISDTVVDLRVFGKGVDKPDFYFYGAVYGVKVGQWGWPTVI